MVGTNLNIQCPICKKEVFFQCQSGEFNGKMGDFKCEHYQGEIFVTTKIGWLLGTNAEVKYSLNFKCLRCDSYKTVEITAKGNENKSNIINADFCSKTHYLTIRYSQESVIGAATDYVNSWVDWIKS